MLDRHRIIITPPVNPTPEVDSESGANKYYAQLTALSHQELCIELSNVLAAKNNEMIVPADLGNQHIKQMIVTDLTDKATMICFIHFGRTKIIEYCDEQLDMQPDAFGLQAFNALLNDVDAEVAQLDIGEQLDMQADAFGSLVFDILAERLKKL